jgi:hypothetical protein
MPGGFIRNVGNARREFSAVHRCIQIYGSRLEHQMKDGTALHMATCKTNTDQKWEITAEGFIRSVVGGRKCVDTRSKSFGYSFLELQNCQEPSNPAIFLEAKWYMLPDGSIKNKLTLECIDVFGRPGKADGARIVAYDCGSPLTADQQWRITPEGFIVNLLSNKCIDVLGDPGTGNMVPLVLWPCEFGMRGTDQRWSFSPEGFLQNQLSSKCLIKARFGLVLADCPTTQQRWEQTPAGQLKNRLDGRCLDALPKPGDLNQKYEVVLQDCNPERKLQRWDVLLPEVSGDALHV